MKSMKKQIIYLIISFAVVFIGVVFYMDVLQKRAQESLLERIPASKPHAHVSPAGDVVEHTHTPIRQPKVKPKSGDPDPTTAKHPILRVWENLDLADIKRKYQPYTVSEMMEKWDEKFQNFERPDPELLKRSEAYMSTAEWLQHLLDHGYPFTYFGHYQMAINFRFSMPNNKERFYNPETRSDFLTGFRLPEDTTWEEFEDFRIKWNIVARVASTRAADVDPSIAGGTTDLNGVFTPFSPNKVYVHVSEDKPMSTFTGVVLSEEQRNDLTMYGVAPEGITVVYTDEKGVPLPADAAPRFYERKMAALEAAEAHVEQLIAEHEALLKTLPAPAAETGLGEGSAPSQEAQLRDTQTHPRDRSAVKARNRHPDIPIDRRNIPIEMLPSEPPSRANIQQWFEVLQEVHGGELPKDLRVLQTAINELEEIRQAAADKQQAARQRPIERSAPQPPSSAE